MFGVPGTAGNQVTRTYLLVDLGLGPRPYILVPGTVLLGPRVGLAYDWYDFLVLVPAW